MAAEFTADRFGLLSCRDVDAVLRLEMQMSAGRSMKSIRFDTGAYLEQCRAVAEATIAGGGIATGASHPEHYIRGYAEWLFSETDVYRSITGAGSGSRSLDEVDAVVQALIGFPRERHVAPTVIAKPLPRAVVGAPDAQPAPKRASKSGALEASATDILSDGVRGKLAAARDALATVASAAVPSIRRLADAAREQLGSSEASPPVRDDPSEDPLEDERRDLIARFEELERRSKDK
jgi:hypothetical protein